jgi:hypothetical protein
MSTKSSPAEQWLMIGFIESQLDWMLESDKWAFNDLCIKASERPLTDLEAAKLKEIYDKFEAPKNR